MNKIFTVALLISVFLVGCRTSSSLVNSNFSYNGRFKDYQTFGFMNFEPNGMSHDQSEAAKKMIHTRFRSLGYHYADKNPDFMVACMNLENEMTLQTFRQANLNLFTLSHESNKTLKEEDRGKVKLPKGSMVVYLIESKSGAMVWLGYSKNYDSMQYNNRNLVASVGKILDNYRVTRYN